MEEERIYNVYRAPEGLYKESLTRQEALMESLYTWRETTNYPFILNKMTKKLYTFSMDDNKAFSLSEVHSLDFLLQSETDIEGEYSLTYGSLSIPCKRYTGLGTACLVLEKLSNGISNVRIFVLSLLAEYTVTIDNNNDILSQVTCSMPKFDI